MDRQTIEAYDLKYSGGDRLRLAGGTELYFERYGEGPPLVIVNNFFIISPLWRNFTKRLATRNQIISYDLRNQGSSSPMEGELEFVRLVEDLKELLDGLGIERAFLVGTSTSTLICRDFAVKYPERVRGLVLVGPLFCPYGSRRRKYLTKSWLNSLEHAGIQGFFSHIYPLIYSDRTIETGGTPAFLALRERFMAVNSHDQIARFLNASLTTDDDPRKLRQIQAPALLMAGEADFLTSRTSLEASARLIEDAEVRQLDFVGHVPYFEATDEFERSIQGFIDAAIAKEQQVPANQMRA